MPVSDPRAPLPPALVLDRSVRRPRTAVLLLHGGRSEGMEAPPRWNLAAARMRPFTRSVLRVTEGHDVLVGRVRYRHRGWNGARADAAVDAQRALDELEELAGAVRVVLVGHSMGGRAALAVAGHELVRGVVGLAPWCPAGEPVEQLADRRIVLVHGDRDRTTDPLGSRDVVRRARAAGADTCAVLMTGGDHAMLRRAPEWHTLTSELVAGLLGLAPLPGPVRRAFEEGLDPATSD
ncbi:alpha/beta fold hydrolase [Streptomyces sp. NBC_01498]|uniref:alpha/beta hydrolase n=1 Tax=Streptomyces sp. NBC_01498 TaxID=2975870 RepID=UPI002E7ADA20|nr:alpha/beta fold hydrolase [Streptomyces sp. NBC_01498]WTL28520.1 alpha/beta fold hydrolase [Streptomyces sp. NBC_01498]